MTTAQTLPTTTLAMRAIRLLIVDGSLYTRMALSATLARQPDIDVVGDTDDADAALGLVKGLAPDVVTVDLDAADIDGIEVTRAIIALGIPVIALSDTGDRRAEATLGALEAGAVDYIAKADLATLTAEMADKVRFWGGRARDRLPAADQSPALNGSYLSEAPDLLVIASGDGSPHAMRTLLGGLGTPPVPVIVAQEMAPAFTRPFVEFLRRATDAPIVEARSGDAVAAGMITVLPGGKSARLLRDASETLTVRLARPGARALSDGMLASAASSSRRPMAVVLGGKISCAHGAEAFARRHRPILVQDPGSCLSRGMPDSVLAADAEIVPASLPQLTETIRSIFQRIAPSCGESR